MSDRVMGLETEYASVWLGNKQRPSRQVIYEALAEQILSQVGLEVPATKSIFLANGGRLYFDDEAQDADNGMIEWATPECRTALQASLYDLAGEVLLAEALPAVESKLGGRLALLKNNTDSAGHTYGCHENYLLPRKSRYLPNEADFKHYLRRCLIPFLITRQILCGAGQVGRYGHLRDEKFGFQLSQRADFIISVLSDDARGHRSIINTRDEPHADPRRFRRLHILVGDANVSTWCTWIKLGTTQLVLDVIDEMALNPVLTLPQPITALRNISYNGYEYRVPVLWNGRETTCNALEIQRQYLDAVKTFYQYTLADADRTAILDEWGETLNYLEKDPFSLGDRVDWTIKLQLMKEQRLLTHQPGWNDPSLSQINIRYHDIHPEYGLGHMLREEGIIFYGEMQEAFQDDKIVTAARFPPETTRARVRGHYVSQCSQSHITPHADWTSIQWGDSKIQLDDPLDFSAPFLWERGPFVTTELNFLRSLLSLNHNHQIRLRAILTLGRLDVNTPFLFDVLQAGANDPDWQIRAKTVEILGRFLPVSTDILQAATKDIHVTVRQRAQSALTKKARGYA